MSKTNFAMWNNFTYNFNKILMKLCIQNVYANKCELKDFVSTSVLFSLSFYAHWKIFNDLVYIDLRI